MNLDKIFKALGDQNRLRILNLLLENEFCVCEIEKVLGLTQSNVSRHLQVLKNKGIVSCRKTSQWVYYRVSDEFCKEYGEFCEFLKTKLSSQEPFKSDLARCEEEKKKGFSCEKTK
ncbi:transcriptional regulator [Caldicellulosiruptor changbaiensis]|uniref:Transcriptional regulator n=1 Tax=Caldicellulosiruptor changbaiensis TaxID=1222016 RepID=A0A3T0D8E0_9FIRM|nr:metalloregulator ArsR/SmtB family transcription factor [Caldicellulosiruptor changbaiensis]AZT91246.1 transcriptional regulator [Caldicellulosiruptor changbaiensis]